MLFGKMSRRFVRKVELENMYFADEFRGRQTDYRINWWRLFKHLSEEKGWFDRRDIWNWMEKNKDKIKYLAEALERLKYKYKSGHILGDLRMSMALQRWNRHGIEKIRRGRRVYYRWFEELYKKNLEKLKVWEELYQLQQSGQISWDEFQRRWHELMAEYQRLADGLVNVAMEE